MYNFNHLNKKLGTLALISVISLNTTFAFAYGGDGFSCLENYRSSLRETTNPPDSNPDIPSV